MRIIPGPEHGISLGEHVFRAPLGERPIAKKVSMISYIAQESGRALRWTDRVHISCGDDIISSTDQCQPHAAVEFYFKGLRPMPPTPPHRESMCPP